MIDCTCGFAKDIPESQRACPNCGIDLTPLHRLRAIPTSYYHEGVHFAEAGDLDKALESFMAAIALDSGSTAAYFAVGNIFAQKHLYDEALHNYDRALELAPESESVKAEKVKVLEARRKNSHLVSNPRFYWVAAAALVIGLIVTPTFEHFARQRGERAINISQLAAGVRRNLDDHPLLANLDLKVSAGPNGLTISGEVPSDLYRDLIAEIAKNAGGNQVAVNSVVLIRATTSATETSSGFVYTVRPGDTLTALAERFYGDSQKWERIFEANRGKIADPRNLAVRQVLRIPSRN